MQSMAVPLHVYDVGLEVLSPVAIGAGETEKLSAYTDYLYEGRHVRILDQKKLMRRINEHPELIEEYVRGIRGGMDNNRSTFDLKRFINDTLKCHLDDVTASIVESQVDPGRQAIIRCVSSNGKAFIPGSSLKGALRTAVLLDWLIEDDASYPTYSRIGELIELPDPKAGELLGALEVDKACFGPIENDQFRYLHVSDLHSQVTSTTCITTRLRIHTSQSERYRDNTQGRKYQNNRGQKQKSDMRFQCEAIKPGSKFDGELRLYGRTTESAECDRHVLEHQGYFDFLRKNDLASLLMRMNAFSLFIVEREIGVLSKINRCSLAHRYYKTLHSQISAIIRENTRQAIVRLGHGKTWFDNSIGLMYKEEVRDQESHLRGLIGLAFEKDEKRRKVLAAKDFPKTRTFTELNRKPDQPFGWIKLTFTPRGN